MPPKPKDPDPKFRVTMTNVFAAVGGGTAHQKAVDYVPKSMLDGYVADARTRWQDVQVSTEIDYGPGGPPIKPPRKKD